MRPRLLFVIASVAACLCLLRPSPARAGDWPAHRHDADRSAVADADALPAFPLRLAWSRPAAQPPRPAWPDTFRLLNRMDFDYAPQIVAAGGIVCLGSSADDTVRAFDAATGEEKWRFTTGGPVRFAPHLALGKAYFASDDGFAYCVDAATGKLAWKFRAAPRDERKIANNRMISRWPIRSGVVVADGAVYFAAGLLPAEGVFYYALDAKTGEVLWCNDTAGGTPQGAALAHGDSLLFPQANQGPLPLNRLTGAVINLHGGSAKSWGLPGAGGTWVTIDGTNEYSFALHRSGVLALMPTSLAHADVPRPWGAGVVPQVTIAAQAGPTQIHEKAKVSAIVRDGVPYVRKAWGLALAGNALLLGQDGYVSAERSGPTKSAEVRFGLAGDELLVHASVVEPHITQAATPWKGSCVEVFGSNPGPGKQPIGQIFLVPQTEKEPARAFRSEAGKLTPAPEIRVLTTTTPTGYELSAVVPVRLLELSMSSANFMLEAQVTVTGPDATLQRDTLFGSVSAYMDSQKFRAFKLKAGKPGVEPNGVKAAVAAEPGYTITLKGTGELWRAEVDGEAREIAVADGRVFVSTDKGTVYAFESASAPKRSDAVHAAPAPSLAPPVLPEPVLKRIREAGMDRGFALVLNNESATTALALAAQTQLQVVLATTNESAAAAMREKILGASALYGSRISVQTVDSLERLPFAQFFANTILVDAPLAKLPGLAGKELFRLLRPCGGLLLSPGLEPADRQRLVQQMNDEQHELAVSAVDGSIVGSIVRGKLPGALDWDTDRKAYTVDQRVKWPLRPLWIGGPSTTQLQNFTEDNPGPTVGNGRSYTFSEDALTAVDAYNGEVLWTRPVPKKSSAARLIDGVLYPAADVAPYGKADLLRNVRPQDDVVYVDLGPGYFQGKGAGWIMLDARTGEQKLIQAPVNPPTVATIEPGKPWSLPVDAAHSGTVAMEPTPGGLTLTLTTKDAVASPLDSWEISIDARPAELRYGLYEAGAFRFRVVPASGKTPASWSPINGTGLPKIEVTGTRDAGGTSTKVVVAWTGAAAKMGMRPATIDFAATLNSHDGGAGEPIVRRHLFGDWAADGVNNGWARVALSEAGKADLAKGPTALTTPPPAPANVAAKPAPSVFIPGPDMVATPGLHPLTGEPVPKITGFAPVCGGTNLAANVVFGQGRLYDLADNSGNRSLYAMGGVKTGCSTPSFAALGLLFISEERGHCVCNHAYHTTVVLAPAERRLNEDWAKFYDRDVDTVVRHAHVLLGAPGDRRDARGDLWLGFPRDSKLESPEGHPNPDHPLAYPIGMRDAQTGLWYRRSIRSVVGLPVDIEYALGAAPGAGLGPYHINGDRVPVNGTGDPWIYSSGCRGIAKATVQLNFLKALKATPAPAPGTPGAITLDGKLDEPTWVEELKAALAPPATKKPAKSAADPLAAGAAADDTSWAEALKTDAPATPAGDPTMAAAPPAITRPPELPYTNTHVLFRQDAQNLYVGVTRPPMTKWGRLPREGSTAGFVAKAAPWQRGHTGKPAPETVDRLGKKGKQVTAQVADEGDSLSPSDNWWRLVITGKSDKSAKKAVYLTVTPDNAKSTALYDEDAKKLDRSWSAPWESAVVADDKGMSIEMAIPWTTLEKAGLAKDDLAVNFLMMDPGLGTEALTYLGLDGLNHCTNFTPLGLGKPAPVAERLFTVRLHFAEPDGAKPGQRVFDVALQGKPVLKQFDIAKEAGANKALAKEFKHVAATEAVTVEFTPAGGAATGAGGPMTKQSAPILNALEVVEEGVQQAAK
ncbi:MAG: PQQ-binding-like beta-propeller repeat protein [Planctomycetota bacterium]|nr:PQQ-binding-like beta-propeller repeat protein [Planctomycetota bacterium]